MTLHDPPLNRLPAGQLIIIGTDTQAVNLYRGAASQLKTDADLAVSGLLTASAGLTVTGTVTGAGFTKTLVGLSNVDNTSDANKPVSTAQATANALALAKASNLSDLASVATAKTNLALVKGDVGLGNVDNTSDATKNAAAVTLTNKTLTSPTINSPTGLTKADVGLGNVDNTSDATKLASVADIAIMSMIGAY